MPTWLDTRQSFFPRESRQQLQCHPNSFYTMPDTLGKYAIEKIILCGLFDTKTATLIRTGKIRNLQLAASCQTLGVNFPREKLKFGKFVVIPCQVDGFLLFSSDES
jgi:hypothetical protein